MINKRTEGEYCFNEIRSFLSKFDTAFDEIICTAGESDCIDITNLLL